MNSSKCLFFHAVAVVVLVLVSVLTLVAAYPAAAQQIEPVRVANKILNGQMVNASVTVYGVVDKLDIDKASNTIAYVLKDDWGDMVTVIATGEHPETHHKRYRVSGYVSHDQANRAYVIMETQRSAIEPLPVTEVVNTSSDQTEPRINWTMIALIIGVVLVLVALGFVLIKSRSGTSTEDFGSDAVVTVADKTQKITAAVADQKAVDAGTVKVMPGRFEVAGGTELKEIRLIRPSGVPDHRLEYTFGRLAGDRITHVQLNDSTVSSSQARLKFREGKYTLINIPDPNDPDRNATILNNEEMKADEGRALSEGDTIQMGHVSLIYHEK
jgi:hypothetical protein